MIKITYEPFKQIVIKEYIRFERIEDLIFTFAQARISGDPVILSWANGIAFIHSPLILDNNQIVEDLLNGKVYWTNVSFAEMPKYKPIFETREKAQVPIINVNSSPLFREVAEWLKQQK